MLSTIEQVLFVVLIILSAAMTWRSFGAVHRIIIQGRGPFPTWANVRDRLTGAARQWLLEPDIWRTRRMTSLIHFGLALAFVFFFVVNFSDFYFGFTGRRLYGDSRLGNTYRLFTDFISVAVLTAMVYFVLRRFITHRRLFEVRENIPLMDAVRRGGPAKDSLLVAGFILLHVGARLVGESFMLAYSAPQASQPIGSTLSRLWVVWSADALVLGMHASWWLSIGLILLFLPYFPFTKHFHLIMSGVNFLTKPQRSAVGSLDVINFNEIRAAEDERRLGASALTDLPFTQLVDAYACIMCNRCQDICPAYASGSDLSPAAVEINKAYHLRELQRHAGADPLPATPLLAFATNVSALWACTACMACIDICPVGAEPMLDLMEMRRERVLRADAYPQELQHVYTGMSSSGNPWHLPSGNRMAWAKGLEVPTCDELPEADILWWVGCASAYERRAKETARAFAQLLHAAHVSFAVLGERERCTGDGARRTGNEYLFQQLAAYNIETLNQVQPKRIVTTCPHCLHTLGTEYRQLGGHYEVVHHTQFLHELMADGRLQLSPKSGDKTSTYHDPCYLSRAHGIIEPPRELLAHTTASSQEMTRHGTNTFCCGAGGGQVWVEQAEGTTRINRMRYDEACATNADIVATACPFCQSMLTDAQQERHGGPVVKDIAQLLLEQMEGS